MFGIEHTYTGGCCLWTLPLPRFVVFEFIRLTFIDVYLIKAVVLAHRPPISIPRTTVAPALLEELLGEVGSLASVYHKPSETFIGKGRIGADAVRKAGEYVVTGWLDILAIYHFLYPSLAEDQFSTQKALQTVVAGQQAENLLYVDYDVIFMEIPS